MHLGYINSCTITLNANIISKNYLQIKTKKFKLAYSKYSVASRSILLFSVAPWSWRIMVSSHCVLGQLYVVEITIKATCLDLRIHMIMFVDS